MNPEHRGFFAVLMVLAVSLSGLAVLDAPGSDAAAPVPFDPAWSDDPRLEVQMWYDEPGVPIHDFTEVPVGRTLIVKLGTIFTGIESSAFLMENADGTTVSVPAVSNWFSFSPDYNALILSVSMSEYTDICDTLGYTDYYPALSTDGYIYFIDQSGHTAAAAVSFYLGPPDSGWFVYNLAGAEDHELDTLMYSGIDSLTFISSESTWDISGATWADGHNIGDSIAGPFAPGTYDITFTSTLTENIPEPSVQSITFYDRYVPEELLASGASDNGWLSGHIMYVIAAVFAAAALALFIIKRVPVAAVAAAAAVLFALNAGGFLG
ncbi:MAG: hypothetical protein LBJ20_08395 [Candidatus Methanoplasma sp.]|jgi:hypothetical protein|nr:hypothetical protein [Candidatus Methanoplasma sp.]